VTYYYTDGQGTVLAQADAAGTVTHLASYRPYGASASQPEPDGPGFHGAAEGEETSLIYMQARYMDPDTGRFISRDPLASEFNAYSYATNNPERLKDPTGLYSCKASKDECQRFERGLADLKSIAATMQTGQARGLVVAAYKSYGTKDDGNGVNVTFGIGDSPAVTRFETDGSKTVNIDSVKFDEMVGPDGPHYSNHIEFAAMIAHEGQHLVDGLSTYDLGRYDGVFSDESSAFITQSLVNRAAGSISRWWLWQPGSTRADMAAAVVDNATRAADEICKKRACK
jgi:RHS repeat-associated protein